MRVDNTCVKIAFKAPRRHPVTSSTRSDAFGAIFQGLSITLPNIMMSRHDYSFLFSALTHNLCAKSLIEVRCNAEERHFVGTTIRR